MKFLFRRSTIQDRRPRPVDLEEGEVVINVYTSSPGVYFKDTAGNLVKAGPCQISPTVPQPSNHTTPSNGEFWFNGSELRVYDNGVWKTTNRISTSANAQQGSLWWDAGSLKIYDTNQWKTLTPYLTKGQLITSSGTNNQALSVGADGQILQADSAQTTGLTWVDFSFSSIQGAILNTQLPSRLKEVAAVTSNWNTALTSGFYYGIGAQNAPSAGHHIGLVYQSTSSQYIQVLYDIAVPGVSYQRNYYLGSWTAWQTILPLTNTNQSLLGIKTFTESPIIPTPSAGDNSTKAASTAYVDSAIATRAPINSPTFTGTPKGPTATPGASNTQLATTAFVTAADNLKANINSPIFTGTPTAPTPSQGNNSTRLATTAYVDTGLGTKANLASPNLTGVPTAPTAAPGTSTTQLATTAFVTTADNLKADINSPNLTGVPTAPTPASSVNSTQLATTAYVKAQPYKELIEFNPTTQNVDLILANYTSRTIKELEFEISASNLGVAATEGIAFLGRFNSASYGSPGTWHNGFNYWTGATSNASNHNSTSTTAPVYFLTDDRVDSVFINGKISLTPSSRILINLTTTYLSRNPGTGNYEWQGIQKSIGSGAEYGSAITRVIFDCYKTVSPGGALNGATPFALNTRVRFWIEL